MSEKYTFPKLLRDYRIEIPVIQRDYAQGRSGIKPTEIRERFVENLAGKIKENSGLHLDFVYGRVRGGEKDESKNERIRVMRTMLSSVKQYAGSLKLKLDYNLDELNEHILADRLILLDGQQRLTTLYLLYRYLAVKANQSQSINFANFTYKTRNSSRDFCTHLAEVQLVDLDQATKPSLAITNHREFHDSWLHDPTVAGMLTVLDEIHKHFKAVSPEDATTYFARITDEDGPITFDFFDLDSIHAEDELYVKMNARGRQLDKFENFKAWLIDYIKNKRLHVGIDKWDEHLDMDWKDIFWQKRKNPESVDAAQWNFFVRLGQYDLLRTLKTDTGQAYRERRNTALQLDIDTFDGLIPFSFFSANQIFNNSSIEFIFAILHRLAGKGHEKLDILLKDNGAHTFISPSLNFSSVLFSGEKLSSYPDRVFLYSILCFIVKNKKQLTLYDDDDKAAFRSWQRVCQNLIYNARIDEFPEYISALVSIDQLSRNFKDILQVIQHPVDITYFSKDQVVEEADKAKLILSGQADEQILLQYEKHFYLYGQIGFLLKRATRENQFDQADFVQLAERFSSFFKEEHMDDPHRRLQRAMICYGDYTIGKTSERYNFCSNKRGNSRERDENWRAVFVKTEIMDAFFNDSRDIHTLINQEKMTITDWRWYFANYASTLSECKQSLISWHEEPHDIPYVRLLTQSQLNHYHYELFSFALSRNFEETFGYNCKAKQVKSSGETAYCTVSGFDNQKPKKKIAIRYTEHRFFHYSYDEHTWSDLTDGKLQTAYPDFFELVNQQIQAHKQRFPR